MTILQTGKRPSACRGGSRRGFALVDVLLAVSFLVLGIVPMLRAYAVCLDGIRRAREAATAEDALDAVVREAETCALEGGDLSDLPEAGETEIRGVVCRWERQLEPGGGGRAPIMIVKVRNRDRTWHRTVVQP